MMVDNPKIHLLPEQPDPKYALKKAIFRDFRKVFGTGSWGSDANICLRPINSVVDALWCAGCIWVY
jgi:hypothetical protein